MKKAKLTQKQVKYVAKLANLHLTSAEVKKFQKQLSGVLDYFEVLKEVDTTGVKISTQTTKLENVFREDKPGKPLSQKQALSGAKNKHKGMFRVKAIFDFE